MPTTYVWIIILVGVFLAGIGIGDAVFSNTNHPTMMFQDRQMFNQMMGQNPQTMSWMMEDPQLRQQMFEQMAQNPNQMTEWMNIMMTDPQATQKIHNIMMNDPQHMEKMMNDPQHMQKMADMMKTNQEMRSHMMGLMNGTMGNMANMGSGMMNP